MSDDVIAVLATALRGLADRQRVTADNIANVQTPGFQAGRVDFESSLRNALLTGQQPDGTVMETRSGAPSRPDGNNVNLDDETVSTVETGLQYQLVVSALNAKYQLLRTAIKGEA